MSRSNSFAPADEISEDGMIDIDRVPLGERVLVDEGQAVAHHGHAAVGADRRADAGLEAERNLALRASPRRSCARSGGGAGRPKGASRWPRSAHGPSRSGPCSSTRARRGGRRGGPPRRRTRRVPGGRAEDREEVAENRLARVPDLVGAVDASGLRRSWEWRSRTRARRRPGCSGANRFMSRTVRWNPRRRAGRVTVPSYGWSSQATSKGIRMFSPGEKVRKSVLDQVEVAAAGAHDRHGTHRPPARSK